MTSRLERDEPRRQSFALGNFDPSSSAQFPGAAQRILYVEGTHRWAKTAAIECLSNSTRFARETRLSTSHASTWQTPRNCEISMMTATADKLTLPAGNRTALIPASLGTFNREGPGAIVYRKNAILHST